LASNGTSVTPFSGYVATTLGGWPATCICRNTPDITTANPIKTATRATATAELGGPGGSLGYATAVEQELWCAEQHFERGQMFWLDQLREDPIYMLYYGAGEPGGNWQRYVDTWREGDPESAGLAPPTGLFEPIRGFGQLWREELNGPSALIGWALEPEQGFTGSVQPFEHGLMLWTPLDQAVYVLWDDGTWTAYPVLR